MGERDKLQTGKWEIMIIYSNGIEHGKKKKTPPKGRERLENNLLIILKEQAKAEKILVPDQFELFIACFMFCGQCLPRSDPISSAYEKGTDFPKELLNSQYIDKYYSENV